MKNEDIDRLLERLSLAYRILYDAIDKLESEKNENK